MMRPPSLVKPYDEFFSGDPALLQLDANATDEQIAQHVAKIRVARETGDMSALLVPGQTHTKFVMRPLPADVEAALDDYRTAGNGNRMNNTVMMLVVRAALIKVVGFTHPETGADWVIEHHVDPRYPALGRIATADIVNAMWLIEDADGKRVGHALVGELCTSIIDRANGLRPKS